MFGDSLLVAPVFHRDTADIYIPSGVWTDIWTRETVTGPRWIRRSDIPLHIIPVYVRPNSVLALGPEDVMVPDYDYSKSQLELRSYALEHEVEVEIPVGPGSVDFAGVIKVGPRGVVSANGFQCAMEDTSVEKDEDRSVL